MPELYSESRYCVSRGFPLKQYPPTLGANTYYAQTDMLYFLRVILWVWTSDVIVVHGLFNTKILISLLAFFSPAKILWVIWGGDLKANGIMGMLRRLAMQRFNGIVYLDKHDVKRFSNISGRSQIKASAGGYPNPISLQRIKRAVRKQKQKQKHSILIGNSATATNQHAEIFEALKHLSGTNIEFVVPLGYGDPEYRAEVLALGRKILGDSFRPLEHQLSIDDYVNILANINVAVFYANRQQALSNIYGLCMMGAKVFLNPTSGLIESFQENWQVKLYDFDEFLNSDRSLDTLLMVNSEIIKTNQSNIQPAFDNQLLIDLWKKILV